MEKFKNPETAYQKISLSGNSTQKFVLCNRKIVTRKELISNR